MKTFGTDEITWRDVDGVEHIIVATKGGNWSFLCRTEAKWQPSKPRGLEYETIERDPKPTTEPTVWKHDRSKVTCADCAAAIDRLSADTQQEEEQ